jgi:hypothetical protein
MKKTKKDKISIKQMKEDFENGATIQKAPGSLTDFEKLQISADWYGYKLVKKKEGEGVEIRRSP